MSSSVKQKRPLDRSHARLAWAPVRDRLSMTTTSSPFRRWRAAALVPMNPAPPVMMTFMREPDRKIGALGAQYLLVQFDHSSRVFLPGECGGLSNARLPAACPPFRLLAPFSQ